MYTKTFWALAIGIMFFIGSVGTGNAELFIYPKEGQSKEKQEMDEFQCHKWAVDQTGFDPMKSQASATQAQPQQGGMARGAARGAALGAAGGAIGGDTGKGAAIGAGVGAMRGGMRRRQSRQKQQAAQQQAAQQSQAQMQGFNKAQSACLKGRGYTVE
jgi:hypothetical protein